MNKIITSLLLFLSLQVFAAQPNVLLYNVTDKTVLTSTEQSDRLSIASISKLMTVYTVLNENQNLQENLTVKSKIHNHTRISKGMKLSRLDLVRLSLISSDNLAAITLSENFPGGQEAFINAMNRNATQLGMISTVFYEPTGLDANNTSTLHDISLLTYTVSKMSLFREAAESKGVDVRAVKGKKTVKIHGNPTIVFFGREGVTTIKTGFTNAAGWCVTMLVHSNDKLYNLVILGAKTKQQRMKLIEQSLKTIHFA